MRGLVAVCAIGGAALAVGCQSLLGLDPIPAPSIDGGRLIDSIDAAAGPPTCAPLLEDDFTSDTPCAPGGYSWGAKGSLVTQDAGIVSISPEAQAMDSAGCTTNDDFAVGTGGIVVQLVQPLDGSDAYTGLQLAGPGGALGVENGMLLFSNLGLGAQYGMTAYTAAMQWIRIRPSPGGLVGEYWDDTGWVQVGTARPAPTRADRSRSTRRCMTRSTSPRPRSSRI